MRFISHRIRHRFAKEKRQRELRFEFLEGRMMLAGLVSVHAMPQHSPEGQVQVFQFTLSEPSSGIVEVYYHTYPGTATENVDYTGKSGYVSIPPGITSTGITVQNLSDSLQESSETYAVLIDSVIGAGVDIYGNTATAFIDDVQGGGGPNPPPGPEPQASINLDDGIAEAQEEDEPGRVMAFTEDGDKSSPIPIQVSFTMMPPVTDAWTVTFTFSSNLLRLFKSSSDPSGMAEITSGTQYTTLTAPHLVYATMKDPPVAGMGSVTATLHTPGGQNVSDTVTVSVVKFDLDPAAWTDPADEGKEIDPGIVVALDQMSAASHQSLNLPVVVSSGFAGVLVVANTSIAGVQKPHLDFDASRLVIKDWQGNPLQSGAEVNFGATLNIVYANRVNTADEQGGETSVHLIFDNDVVDTTIVHWTSLRVETVPSYLFGQAKYAAPIEFLVPGVGEDVSVSNINVQLFDTSTTTSMYIVGQWSIGDRWVNGDGATSTGSTTHNNGVGNEFTVFLPSNGLASISGLSHDTYSEGTWFSITATVTTSNGSQLVLGSLVSPGAVWAKPRITYSPTVDAIDLGKSVTEPEQKTMAFNIDRTGDTHFGRAEPDAQGNPEQFVDSSAGELVGNWDFTYAEANFGGAPFIDAHARLVDATTFGGNVYGDAMAFSSQIGGYTYFSYGGRWIPSILGASEHAMALDLDAGTGYSDIFNGSQLTIQLDADSYDLTAYALSTIASVTGVAWALAPTPVTGAVFGTISSLASLAATYWNPVVGDRQAIGFLRPFDELVHTDGTVFGNGAFQTMTGPQSNTPFSMMGERVVYTGSRMARYVIAAAEVTVESCSWWMSHNEATADVSLEPDGTHPNALSQFTVMAWV